MASSFHVGHSDLGVSKTKISHKHLKSVVVLFVIAQTCIYLHIVLLMFIFSMNDYNKAVHIY